MANLGNLTRTKYEILFLPITKGAGMRKLLILIALLIPFTAEAQCFSVDPCCYNCKDWEGGRKCSLQWAATGADCASLIYYMWHQLDEGGDACGATYAWADGGYSENVSPCHCQQGGVGCKVGEGPRPDHSRIIAGFPLPKEPPAKSLWGAVKELYR
jgi:hypothetical protein